MPTGSRNDHPGRDTPDPAGPAGHDRAGTGGRLVGVLGGPPPVQRGRHLGRPARGGGPAGAAGGAGAGGAPPTQTGAGPAARGAMGVLPLAARAGGCGVRGCDGACAADLWPFGAARGESGLFWQCAGVRATARECAVTPGGRLQ